MNEAGRDRFTSKLTVESAPKIKLGAGRVNADINDPVTLECETEGFLILAQNIGNRLTTNSK